MPNKNTQWCVALNSGNPTRSTLVNNLIKDIKQKEVRKEGKVLMARRPLEIDEFRHLIKKLHESTDSIRKCTISCMAKFQYVSISRLDDTARVEREKLTPNAQFPFSLQFR